MLLIGALLAAAPIPAEADVGLTSTTPAAGALLPAAPDEVRLTFSGPVAPDTVSATVAVDGRNPIPAQTSAGGSSVRVTLTTTPPGPAEQLWRVAYQVQADDGHPATGSLDFSVAPAPGARSPTPGPVPTSTRPSSPASPVGTASPPATADPETTAGPPGMPGPTDQHRPTSRWYFFVIGAAMLFLGPLVALAWSSRPPENAERTSPLVDEPAAERPGPPTDPPPPPLKP